jgi:hypothetical protein
MASWYQYVVAYTYEVTIFNALNLQLRFKVVLLGQKEQDNILSIVLIIMPILWLVCIKQEESIVTVCRSLLRKLKNLEH